MSTGDLPRWGATVASNAVLLSGSNPLSSPPRVAAKRPALGTKWSEMDQRLVTVFGGSGFIGRHLVQRLARRGARIRVATRRPEAAGFLQPMGDVGQIAATQANLRNEPSVTAAVTGADAVVNLVGVLHESGRQTFSEIHATGAARVATAAAKAGVGRLIHISAIGADEASPAAYGRSKAFGEANVRRELPAATIIRPSIVFGPEDDFFNRFAALARLSPALPLIGGGETRFQPVYVGDVADGIMAALGDPAAAGRTYELGGPRILNFREVLEMILAITGHRRLLLPVPFPLARALGTVLQLVPNPPMTRDQVSSLQRDSVVAFDALTLADLGITPTPAEGIVASYLRRYRRAGASESHQAV